jgi:hypothetical protein
MDNSERAAHAAEGLAAYLRSKGEYDSDKPLGGLIEDYEVADLVCDLLHLADRLGHHHQDVIDRALWHYQAEVKEGAA